MSRYSDVILNDNPVAYYRLNDSWGTPGAVGPGNPGFENQTNGTAAGWISGAVGTGTNNTADTSNPHTGIYNLKLTNPSNGNYGAVWGGAGTQAETPAGGNAGGTITGIPTNGAKQVQVTFWARGSAGATTGPFRLTFSNTASYTNQPSANAGTTSVDNNFTVTTAYQPFVFTINIPAGFQFMYIEIYSSGNGTASSVYVDDISFVWQTNTANDPSFESGILTVVQTYWDLGTPSEFSIDTTNFVTGTQSLKCTTTRTSAGWNPAYIKTSTNINSNPDLIPVVAGQQYFVSFWWKSGAGSKQTHMKVQWFTSGGVFLSANFVLGGTDGPTPWTYVSGTITAPATAAYCNFILMYGYWDGVTGTNAQMWFDNINFQLYSMAREFRGNGPDGILIGGVTPQIAGATGDMAMTFDGGTTTCLEIPHVPGVTNFNRGTNFSVEFWMKSTQAAGDHSFLEKWVKDGGAASSAYPYVFRFPSSQVSFGRYDGTNNPGVTSATTLNDGNWHHIVGVLSGTTMQLYVDGLLSSSGTDTTTTETGNNDPLIIANRGGGSPGGSGHPFAGSLDEIALYNYALTGAQVAAHFAAAPVPFTAPIGGNTLSITSFLFTLPTHLDIATTEVFPFNINIGSYVVASDVVTTFSAVLFNSFGAQITSAWLGTMVLANNILTIPITGSALGLGQPYLLLVTVNLGAYKKLSFFTNVKVVA